MAQTIKNEISSIVGNGRRVSKTKKKKKAKVLGKGIWPCIISLFELFIRK